MQHKPLPLPAVHQDQYRQWLDDPVTKHLLSSLESMYMDSMLDLLPTKSMEQLAIMAIKRESYREVVDQILEWSPEGCEGKNDAE